MMQEQDRIDKRQLKTLLKTSIKTDLRGSHNPFQNYGKGESKFPPILGLILLQMFVSIFISAIVYKVGNPFLGTFAVNTIVLVFISVTILLEFSNLILSPEDYSIISPHPVNSRTFFAAKSIHFLMFVGILTAAMSLGPSVAAAIKLKMWWMAPMTFVSAFATALAASLFFILFYTVMLRIVKRETMQRYLGYSQFLFIFIIYGAYMILPRMMENLEKFDFNSLDLWYLNLLPPGWFAAWPALLAQPFSVDRFAAGLFGLLLLAVMVYLGTSKLSLKYALTLADTVDQQEKLVAVRRKGFISRLLEVFANSEDRAVWNLIRAQFKFDNRFKMTVLTIIPLTIMYIYLGLQDGGRIVDPFLIGKDVEPQKNFFLYLAVAFLPFMIVTGTAYSSSAAASWVFFASPSDKAKLVTASTRFAIIFFCIPYLTFLCAIFTYFFGNILHAVLHCLVLLLMVITMLQLMVTILPRIPFSLPAKSGERSLAFFAMFIIPMLFIVVPMMFILYLGYGGMVRYSIILGVLIAICVLTNILLKRLIPRRLAKLEYAEI